MNKRVREAIESYKETARQRFAQEDAAMALPIVEEQGDFQTVSTAKELLLLERWRQEGSMSRIRLYRYLINRREWPEGVDVAALRDKCDEILEAK